MDAELTGSSWHTEDFDIPAYLRRLGIEPELACPELIEALHQAHVRTLPFTNVDILLGTAPGSFTVMLMANRWTDECHVSITDTTRLVRADGRPTHFEEITARDAVEAAVELGIALAPEEREALRDVLVGLRRRWEEAASSS